MRVNGYLPGPEDVYVPLSMIRRMGLRRGDEIEGTVKLPRDSEKYAALSGSTRSTGLEPEESARCRDFQDLTPSTRWSRCAWSTSRRRRPAHHRPDCAHRAGPARPHRLAAQGGQDDADQADRQRHQREQPRGAPHPPAHRRAAGRGHRHAARGQGASRSLDLRPARRGALPGRRAGHRAGEAAGRVRAGTWSMLLDGITRLSPGLQPGRPGQRQDHVRRRRLPARCTRPSGSSGPPATSRRAAP